MQHPISKITILLSFLCLFSFSKINSQSPNILLVIADDLGVDYSNGYHNASLMPTTPNLDQLRATGITFENAFAAPKCTPSRANIMSGKYGIKTNVLGTPGHLDTIHTSIFKAIEEQTNGLYNDAVIGKWHISSPQDPLHPMDHGIDYFMGILSAMVDDYYAWERTENGQTTIDSSYVTSTLTDASINWINGQTEPWFLWLAHPAPHTPFHTPPDSLYTISTTNSNTNKFVAAIESIDHELGRLLDNMDSDVLENTIIIFLGDNGTPNGVLQDYPNQHGKSTLYQGGIRVPLIISGAGVTRQGEIESALIHITDIHATLLEMVGAELPGGLFNSLSFKHLLENTSGSTRDYNYTELDENYTIRNQQYKLIEFVNNGTQEFYDLLSDSLEFNDLMLQGLTTEQLAIKADLEQEVQRLRTSWSCRDYIQNGDEEGIDCGGTHCSPCNTISTKNVLAEKTFISPNPTSDILNIKISSGNFLIKIFDVNGRLEQEGSFFGNQFELDLSDFIQGVYFLKIVDTTTQQSTIKKIIKQ